jgi:hypothetical protein
MELILHAVSRMSAAERARKARFHQTVASVALVGLMVLAFAGPWARIAEAQVSPNPPTSWFVFVPLSPISPVSTNYSYIGTFWVQYRYGTNGLDWWFRIAPKWVQEAGNNKVTLDFTVTARGKQVNNYQTHTERASYFFHSSLDKFQFFGDFPWTSHRLHAGDIIDISVTFAYVVPAANGPGVHTVAFRHDFWAHYRVGVR